MVMDLVQCRKKLLKGFDDEVTYKSLAEAGL